MILPKNLIIKKLRTKGRGVFSTKSLYPGDILEISPYIELPKTDFGLLSKTIIDRYWYEAKNGKTAIGLGYTSLYNHSNKPNAEFSLDHKTKTITIVAISTIKKGQEVTTDYGYTMPEFI